MSSTPLTPLFDTHAHYNLEPLFDDVDGHWQAAQAAGVTETIVVGTCALTSQRAIDLTATRPGLWAAVGTHPSEFEEGLQANPTFEMAKFSNQEIRLLTQLASNATAHKVVAIGECGLDYFRLGSLPPNVQATIKHHQQELFKAQLELARATKLPTILHVRDTTVPETPTPGNAYWDVITLLSANAPLPAPVILHCVSGPLAYLQAALALGAYVGVAGNVTYKNADHIRMLVRHVPADRLLLETDAPFLPPVPHRGKPCQPALVRLTAEFLETELDIALPQLYHNSQRVFSATMQ